jgi:hypothetical protein
MFVFVEAEEGTISHKKYILNSAQLNCVQFEFGSD